MEAALQNKASEIKSISNPSSAYIKHLMNWYKEEIVDVKKLRADYKSLCEAEERYFNISYRVWLKGVAKNNVVLKNNKILTKTNNDLYLRYLSAGSQFFFNKELTTVNKINSRLIENDFKDVTFYCNFKTKSWLDKLVFIDKHKLKFNIIVNENVPDDMIVCPSFKHHYPWGYADKSVDSITIRFDL